MMEELYCTCGCHIFKIGKMGLFYCCENCNTFWNYEDLLDLYNTNQGLIAEKEKKEN